MEKRYRMASNVPILLNVFNRLAKYEHTLKHTLIQADTWPFYESFILYLSLAVLGFNSFVFFATFSVLARNFVYRNSGEISQRRRNFLKMWYDDSISTSTIDQLFSSWYQIASIWSELRVSTNIFSICNRYRLVLSLVQINRFHSQAQCFPKNSSNLVNGPLKKSFSLSLIIIKPRLISNGSFAVKTFIWNFFIGPIN